MTTLSEGSLWGGSEKWKLRELTESLPHRETMSGKKKRAHSAYKRIVTVISQVWAPNPAATALSTLQSQIHHLDRPLSPTLFPPSI